jgi:phosphoenolpyruvate phosphomutase
MKKKKLVYIALAADLLHEGHINILKKAAQHGNVVVGLLTDEAISSYKKIPLLDYDARESIVKNLKMVKKVIPQSTMDYRPNLEKIRPNIVVHGKDWKSGILKNSRKQVIRELKKWSGKLIEYPYTKNISSSIIKSKISQSNKQFSRTSLLSRLIKVKKFVRIIETHSPLVGHIVEKINIKKNNKIIEFDGFWSSSLTDSLLRAKPDDQSVELSTRITALNELFDVTSKPLIFDGDNGGEPNHLRHKINSLERLGVSAIVIEDKIGPKINSLSKNQNKSIQDKIKNFTKKIKIITNARKSKTFLIIARIESFVLGKGLNDSLRRAREYSKAGADAILIHSKQDHPKEIFKFAKEFRKSPYFKPMVSVPSSYSKTYEKELIKNGFSIVIYANHFMRGYYKTINEIALKILNNSRSYEVENKITPIKKILEKSIGF